MYWFTLISFVIINVTEIVRSCFLIFNIKKQRTMSRVPGRRHVTSYRHSTLSHSPLVGVDKETQVAIPGLTEMVLQTGVLTQHMTQHMLCLLFFGRYSSCFSRPSLFQNSNFFLSQNAVIEIVRSCFLISVMLVGILRYFTTCKLPMMDLSTLC
jgi:hypothetical protein